MCVFVLEMAEVVFIEHKANIKEMVNAHYGILERSLKLIAQPGNPTLINPSQSEVVEWAFTAIENGFSEGRPDCLYMLLYAMEMNGNEATKKFAEAIRKKIKEHNRNSK